jgi:hypothetical protein
MSPLYQLYVNLSSKVMQAGTYNAGDFYFDDTKKKVGYNCIFWYQNMIRTNSKGSFELCRGDNGLVVIQTDAEGIISYVLGYKTSCDSYLMYMDYSDGKPLYKRGFVDGLMANAHYIHNETEIPISGPPVDVRQIRVIRFSTFRHVIIINILVIIAIVLYIIHK